MPSEERQFWYALTLVASGLVMIGTTNQNGWGVFLTVVGGLWLLYLERERIRAGLREFLNDQQSEPRPERSLLSPAQCENLIAQLSVVEPRTFGIVRENLPDLVALADQIHALFTTKLGWPFAFRPSEPFYDLPPAAIRVRSKPDDKTAAEVRRILSEVLGVSIGEVIERAQKMDCFEIQIGRKPL